MEPQTNDETVLDQIRQLSSGAQFFRADLHVHSLGGSFDVSDPSATPEGLVDEAISVGLDVLAIADHNEITSVAPALSAAKGSKLLVIPALELSTLSGHLLCYLASLEKLEAFYGKLTLIDRGTPKSRCQTAMLDCLNLLEDHNGFGLLAHVDGGNGLEVVSPGGKPHKLDILCHRSLMGIELKQATSPVSYSDGDPDNTRKQIGQERIKRLELGSKQFIARVLNSDSHTRDALGRNARGDKRVTRFKMEAPSFDAIRIALEDCDARVRIEEEVPQSVPYLEALQLEGGFLDGVRIHLSKNLNCIIGGRGTGKSTTLEATRCLASTPSTSRIVDSEAWPRRILLFWRDEADQSHTLQRDINSNNINVGDPTNGPRAFQVDCYGQGDTARLSEALKKDPLALLSYLDRFIRLKGEREAERVALEELVAIQTNLEKCQERANTMPQLKGDLLLVERQLKAMEKENAKELIGLQRRLAAGKELRGNITDKIRDIRDHIQSMSISATVSEITGLVKAEDLVVGKEQFSLISKAASEFGLEAEASQTQTIANYKRLQSSIEEQISLWKTQESSALTDIDTKRKALEAQGITFNMAFIEKMAKDEARLRATLADLKAMEPKLAKLKKQYLDCKTRRWSTRSMIARHREAYGKRISSLLKEWVTGLVVSLKYSANCYSKTMEDLIVGAMNWKTSSVPRASLLIKRMTAPGLLAAIDKKDASAIQEVLTDAGSSVFSKSAAEQLINTLSEPTLRFALEQADVHDVPRLSVSKMVPDGKGGTKLMLKDYSKLSMGQQQSTLLSLVLASDGNVPLVIDQPEDNLDGEFIYQTLVPVLRRAKERRQVIVVTHNANIAVLGDAEQVIVLKSTSEQGSVTSRGSIDDEQTRQAACGILEGAKEAFMRRAKIYGVT